MRRLLVLLSIILALGARAERIGEWRTYMAYHDVTDIEPAGNMVYVLSSGSLFSYNVVDESLRTYDKVYPLNDCTISHIAWNRTTKRLIIIYDNYNIDFLDNDDNVYNMPDYYNKLMTENKTVNSIMLSDKYAYLNTAFGIIKVDTREIKVSDTYNLGKNVMSSAIKGDFIYANTTQGVYAGRLTDNLLDPANWTLSDDDVSFTGENDIVVTTENGYEERVAYDKDNKCYWSNQKDGKIQSYTMSDAEGRVITRSDINPDGPRYNYFGFIKIRDGKLYSCNGKMWDEGKPASIQTLDIDGDEWVTFDNEGIGQRLGIQYSDIMTLDVDPRDPRRLMAGSQAGLFEFYDGKLVNHWNHENSPIYFFTGIEGNKNYEIVSSVIFDATGGLWIANSESSKSVLVRRSSDGEWSSSDAFSRLKDTDNLKFMGFDGDKLWFYHQYWETPAVYCYNTSTGNLSQYTNFTNEDGMKFSDLMGVSSLALDKEGNVWLGINQGVLVLTDEYQRDPDKGFYQIKVPRGDGTNLADYLLSGIDITAIAVDNANRKWIGTDGNGLYLISSDSMTEEEHFTISNSGLISNTIESLAIDNKTGKVYIGTDKGLCSYMSEASETNEDMTGDNVWAYPNPVRPEYDGMITITGLSIDSDVKITTTNGTLVASGRSVGGSFQWDGRDLKGRRVASGVYMVNTATRYGESGTVCKIAVIN